MFAHEEEITRAERAYHNDKFRDVYSSSNIIRMIKQKTMNWTGM
jgi:hypothetical protein